MSDSRLLKVRTRWFTLALAMGMAVLAVAGWWRSCAADLSGPTPDERNITNIVTLLMPARHLSRKPMDDEISRRAFKLFLEGLDPMKIYFYQSDVDEFAQFRDKLDDMLRRNDTSFAYKVFKRFLQRVDERVATIDQLLAGDFDFTREEELITDPKLLHYPRDAKEARDRWRKRLKYDLLVLKSDKSDKSSKAGKKKEELSPRARLKQRYGSVKRRMHQFDDTELLETFLTAMTTSYDPHTTYMSRDTLENFRIMLSLELEGIGAQLQDRDGKIMVAKIIPGGAAFKADQLKEEDQIISVGQGDDGEMEDIVGMKLTDVVKRIRGKAGSVVRLGVMPATDKKTVTYKITRAKIELKDEAAQGRIFEVSSKPSGKKIKIGVIDLHSFYMDMGAAQRNEPNYRSTTRDVRAILERFKREGANAVVLDLRRNGGGSLIEAISLTGLFIDKGPVVQVMGPDNIVDHYDDSESGMVWGGPLIVLTSKFSASASEILAGAIQDYKRGLIIGDEATHGKGTVQSLLDLGEQVIRGPHAPKLGALKLTMQQFFRPSGDSTQKRGVLSDIMLPSVTNYMDVSESDLDYAIDFRRVQQTSYQPNHMVTPEIITKLYEASKKRVHESEAFAKLFKRIELYRKQKARKRVTLNEKRFLAERAEVNAQKEDEKQFEKQAKSDSTIKEDFYLDEVLAITVDYARVLQQGTVAQAQVNASGGR